MRPSFAEGTTVTPLPASASARCSRNATAPPRLGWRTYGPPSARCARRPTAITRRPPGELGEERPRRGDLCARRRTIRGLRSRMGRDEVPEQDVVLGAELVEDAVDDRRGRLGRAAAGQLPLGRERDPGHPRAAIAGRLADEQNGRVPPRVEVRAEPLTPQRRVGVLVVRRADPRPRELRDEVVHALESLRSAPWSAAASSCAESSRASASASRSRGARTQCRAGRGTSRTDVWKSCWRRARRGERAGVLRPRRPARRARRRGRVGGRGAGGPPRVRDPLRPYRTCPASGAADRSGHVSVSGPVRSVADLHVTRSVIESSHPGVRSGHGWGLTPVRSNRDARRPEVVTFA